MGGLLSKGIEYEADGMTVRQCLFCDIAADKPGLRQTAVAFEDDKVVVFAPLEPCASEHWLVVPRAHHRSASTLTANDLPLLVHMKNIGSQILEQKQPGKSPQDTRFCFHVEPFNSIAHLHLHCQVLPFLSPLSSWKYKVGTQWCWSYDSVRLRLEEE
ncbi:hypothetical protein VYU27_002801 [Nannochloropsis oceanica]